MENNKNIVYVGTRQYTFGRMKMYHMASPNIDELHKMADKLGIQRKWFQEPHKGTDFYHPHYDISKGKKAEAIKLGAIEVNDRELILKCFKSNQP